MKYTQGPWKVHEKRFVAGVDGSPVVNIGNPDPGTAEANARLIAAAPDLISALEEAERVIRWAAQESAGRVKKEIVNGWIHHADSVKAAIAKATNP